ncbi:MAG: SDR family oxidoreductase [Actinobacteria bacterium]|nr:SDR family oxidoreductase [Actinomycetota bacterium]MCG2807760.1 SDR family oxidoreductase [Coriobacteriia bacterium]
MTDHPTVLLLGATGRTGRLVLTQLLDRDVAVRAIVRSIARVPQEALGRPGLALVEADLLAMSAEELQEQVRGCDAVISCLGHPINLKGIYGDPRELVTQAIERVCGAVAALRPSEPIRLVLMSSVSVLRPGAVDARRSALERGVLAVIRALVPPAKDNQNAADVLCDKIGPSDPFVEWAIVRPDTLRDGEVSTYALHEGLMASLARSDDTSMANVAAFMCELVTDSAVWASWKSRLPVIVNATPA